MHEKDMITVFILEKYWKVLAIKNYLVDQLEQSVKCRM